MYNKIMLIGNLGRDPEVRSLPSGTAVCDFSVATTRRWRDKDGNQQENTEWFRVSVFGRQAEIAGRYLAKGRQVFVEGRLETREYTDNSGEKRFSLDVRCDSFQMLGSRDDTGGGGRSGGGSSSGGGGGTGNFGPDDDDIPF